MSSITISPEDMLLFAEASGDWNPLHHSAEYARRTPYGEPLVFGILGTLAAISQMPDRPLQELKSASVTFFNPIFVSRSYQVIFGKSTNDRAKISIVESGRQILSATLDYQSKQSCEIKVKDQQTLQMPRQADSHPSSELVAGFEIRDQYSVPMEPLKRLEKQYRLAEKGVPLNQIISLMWASYFIGMRIPGENALFMRFKMQFPSEVKECSLTIPYQLGIEEVDTRFDLLMIRGQFGETESNTTTIEAWASARPAPPVLDIERIQKRLPSSELMQGKVALVTGGARGLGAAIVAALASQGCNVLVNYRTGQKEAEQLKERLKNFRGKIKLLQCDASVGDLLREAIVEEFGRLDLLICNASPPIRPMAFGRDTEKQTLEFIQKSLSLVTGPIAGLMEELEKNEGKIVVISSSIVTGGPEGFTHYIAAKTAVEGLIQGLVRETKNIFYYITRPGKLLTDTNNTAGGRAGAMYAEDAAVGIVERVMLETKEGDPFAPRIIDQFENLVKKD